MKVKSTLTGKIESPDGDFIVTFRREKINEAMKLDAELRAISDAREQSEVWTRRVMSLIETVEGLTDENGEPYTTEQVRKGEVPDSVIGYIAAAWFKGRNPDAGNKEAEKKE